MEFKIVRVADKRVMYVTKDRKLVPNAKTIKQMEASGYKAFMDGKVYRGAKATK